jgi:hypothetical protein
MPVHETGGNDNGQSRDNAARHENRRYLALSAQRSALTLDPFSGHVSSSSDLVVPPRGECCSGLISFTTVTPLFRAFPPFYLVLAN